MPEFLDEKRREIDARLNELKPLVDEYRRLEAAAAALDGIAAAAPSTKAPSRAARRPAAAKVTPRRRGETNGNRRGRPKGTGKRAKQALEIVTASPGITVPELADKMGIKHNYLYRVLPGLASEGLVTKQGRGWHPKVAA